MDSKVVQLIGLIKTTMKLTFFYWLKTSFIDFYFIFMSGTFHGMMVNVTVTVNIVGSRKTPHGKQGLFAWLVYWMPLQNCLQVVLVFTLYLKCHVHCV